ncbi:MAG: hypothetical protein ACLSBB_18410 [Ruthenibacterium lactatiformans]
MSSYGHVTRFDAPVREAPDELVFTLWFPVYNLPQGDEVIALVAIDFPIAFLNQNCQLVYEDDEQMYIADMGGMILAASDERYFRNLPRSVPICRLRETPHRMDSLSCSGRWNPNILTGRLSKPFLWKKYIEPI